MLPSMVNGDLNAASVASPTLAWAVGDYYTGTSFGSLIEKWNGRAWSVIGKGEPNAQLFAVTTFGSSHAVAVGSIDLNDASVVHALISQWNGLSWNPTALALPAKAKASSLYLSEWIISIGHMGGWHVHDRQRTACPVGALQRFKMDQGLIASSRSNIGGTDRHR